jgi:CRP-like cAMP-binding protein
MLRSLAEEPAFGAVPAPVLHALVGGADVTDARKGDVVYEAGAHWRRLGYVVDGSIAMVAYGEDAKEHLYEQANTGDFFGVSAMFDGGSEMSKTVVVSSRARYASVPHEDVLALCREHGVLALAFGQTLARRVRKTTALLAAQMNLSAHERIARYLLGFASGDGLAPALDPLPNLTQAQIGAAAGTVKDVAARAIGAFERAGALKRERGRVRWLERDRLRELARLPNESAEAMRVSPAP